MSYIIEKVTLFENDRLGECNFIIKGDKIYSRHASVNQMSFMRLCMDKHILIASESVMGDIHRWQERGEQYAESLILLGATTVVFPIDVEYEYELKKKLASAREILKDFPLDFVLILRIPPALLKPAFMRVCRRLYISAIIVKLHHTIDLRQVSWSRIQDALFPYKLLFIPEFTERSIQQLQEWHILLEEEGLIHEKETIALHKPMAKMLLKKLGLYPYKGILRSGGEVSYNAIHKDFSHSLLNQNEMYYDKIDCTVFKNTVIRAGNTVYVPCGLGKELIIKVPGFFH